MQIKIKNKCLIALKRRITYAELQLEKCKEGDRRMSYIKGEILALAYSIVLIKRDIKEHSEKISNFDLYKNPV